VRHTLDVDEYGVAMAQLDLLHARRIRSVASRRVLLGRLPGHAGWVDVSYGFTTEPEAPNSSEAAPY
jgi:hypothetical protein